MQSVSRISIVLGASFLALSISAAQAVSISGGAVPQTFPGYGPGADGKNNVVNQGVGGTGVTDSSGGANFIGTTAPLPGGTEAIVTTGYSLYNVDWWYIGSESGYTNTFYAPDITPRLTLTRYQTPRHS